MPVRSLSRHIPNPGSYIDLDPSAKDELRIPLARIHSQLDETELRRLEFMAKTTRDILKASGVESIFEEYGVYDTFSSTHVFGTCRMGTDPRETVVDRHGRSHRWRNLFVADASVFPSSGGGEGSSLTIEALALRTATHVHDSRKRGEI